MGTRRVGKRTENIKDGALTDFFAGTNGVLHGGMKLGCEHETNPNLINRFANLLRCKLEIETERGKHICAATLRGSGAVAMLRNFSSRACQDKCGCCRNVECMSTITACAHYIINRLIAVCKLHFYCIGAHGAYRASDLRDGLTFHPECNEICTDLRRSCAL